MMTNVIHGLFLVTLPFALVGFFFLTVFMALYSCFKSFLNFDSIPNTRGNNKLLSYSFYSIAVFLLAAGLTELLQGGSSQAFWCISGAVLFVTFNSVLIGARKRDLKLPKNERVPQNRFSIFWKIPTNERERFWRLASIMIFAVILLVIVLLATAQH